MHCLIDSGVKRPGESLLAPSSIPCSMLQGKSECVPRRMYGMLPVLAAAAIASVSFKKSGPYCAHTDVCLSVLYSGILQC